MELASVIINLCLLAATVVAAIIAWRSVRDAQDARDEAKDHERAALAAAASAASSQERIADVLEEAYRPPAEPWIVEQESGYTWRVVNNTGFSLLWAAIGTPLGSAEKRIRTHDDVADNVPTDGKLLFDVIDPSLRSITLWVTWGDPETMEQEKWTKEVPLR